jgi:hypothetical protein
MLLPHKIRKRLRPPLPRNHLVSHKCLGAELLAVLAIRGFIFSARPAKVKTYYHPPTAVQRPPSEAGAFRQLTHWRGCEAKTISQLKVF